MYVCNCNGINEKEIKGLVGKFSIRSIAHLKKVSDVGVGCGLCLNHARKVLKSCKSFH